MNAGFWCECIEEEDQVEDLCVGGRVVLKWIVKDWIGKVWTGFGWCSLGTSDRHSEVARRLSSCEKESLCGGELVQVL